MDEIINNCVPHIGEQIFKHLSYEDLLNCELVCKTWKDLISEREIWNHSVLYITEHDRHLDNIKHDAVEEWEMVLEALIDPKSASKTAKYLTWYHGKSDNYKVPKYYPRDEEDEIYDSDTESESEIYDFQIPPLEFAIMECPKALKFFLALSETKNMPNTMVGTTLHFASHMGKLEACKLIAEFEEDKNPKNKHGHTPLYLATNYKHWDCVEYFWNLTADKDPEFAMLRMSCSKNVPLPLFKTVIKEVKDLDKKHEEDHTYLYMACLSRNFKVAEIIVKEDIKRHGKVTLKWNGPLYAAIVEKQVEFFSIMYRHLNIDSPMWWDTEYPGGDEHDGWNLLQVAADVGCAPIFKMIWDKIHLNKNTTYNVYWTPPNDRRTIFDMVQEKEHTEIIEILQDHYGDEEWRIVKRMRFDDDYDY